MYSGITIGRVLSGEILYTKILEVNLFAFAYRLFRRDFSPIDGTYCFINGHYKRYKLNNFTMSHKQRNAISFFNFFH